MFEYMNYEIIIKHGWKKVHLNIGSCQSFQKKRWDKMTTNLVKSFNAWVKNERHQSICNFIMEHMLKLGALLVKHKKESNNWKGCIGPKIEEKVMTNIAKDETLLVSQFINGFFTISTGKAFVNVDMFNRSYTCRECKWWEFLMANDDISQFEHIQPEIVQQSNW